MKDTELKDHQLTVALRIRPFSKAEQKEGATMVAYRLDEQTMVHLDPLDDPANAMHTKGRDREKSFMFDMVFDDSASQEEVHRATTRGLIEGLISGYNATVFAYGPTGCGKTYTMLGTDEEPGIYVRMLNDLFRAIGDTSDDMLYSVSMSYLEIYNEMIRDLLNPSSGVLELREDGKGGIQVAGITEMSTINAQEIMELLKFGNMERTEEPTAANRTSSRSHAVLQVTVTQQDRGRDIKQEVRIGRLFMIDLAGSERAAQTQNTGLRLKEGAHINLSLLALANCINALTGKCGTKFVNFRDSKLTRLLKDSLCGNCRTVMIAHISPASIAFDESRNTLFYADRAKTIKTKIKKNQMNVPPSSAHYTNIISELRNEIVRLTRQLTDQAILTDRADIRHVQAEVQAHSTQQTRAEMDQLKTQLLDAFRQQMEVKKDLTDLENRNIQIESNTSKHMLTIVDWEQEQKQRKRKWLTEKMKESVNKDESEIESDSLESPPDIAQETQEVAMARESLGTLMNKQKKIHKQKKSLERKFLEIRDWTRQLEQQLPQRLISEEQREVLNLLCKVHELEITNAEMLKDNVILHKNFVMQRFEQHRHLCDEIIQQQRRFIDNHSLLVPSHLQELYVVYLRELDERKVDRAVCLEPSRQTIKEGSLPKITFPSQCPDNIQDIDSDQESIRNMCSDNGRGRTESRRHIFPPIFPQPELDNNRVFKNSPLTEHMKNQAVMTPPPLHTNRKGNRDLQPLATVSSLSYSHLIHSVSSRMGSSPESSEAGADAPAARTEIVKGVNCLTYTTTRRRSKAELDALLLPVAPSPPDLKKQKSSFSKMEAPPRGRLPNPGLRHATSDDNLSCSTLEAPVHAHNRLVAAKNQTPRKAGLKGLKKRRSQSFEVNGQAFPQTKTTTALKLCPLDSASDLHLHSNAQAVPLRPQQRGVPPVTKVRALRNRLQAEPSTAHMNNPRRPPPLQPPPIGFNTSVAGVQRTRRH